MIVKPSHYNELLTHLAFTLGGLLLMGAGEFLKYFYLFNNETGDAVMVVGGTVAGLSIGNIGIIILVHGTRTSKRVMFGCLSIFFGLTPLGEATLVVTWLGLDYVPGGLWGARFIILIGGLGTMFGAVEAIGLYKRYCE